MKDILMSATRLAEQIVNSDEYKNMRLLERDMANDERCQAVQLRYRMAQEAAIEAMKFAQLMNNVNGILKLFITGDSDGEGCSGSCEGCGGCG